MLPVLNRPVVAYAVELLARQQHRQIDISLYEQAAAVEAYLGSGQRWGVKLVYHLHNQPLGDAGALLRAFSDAREPVLVLPADILIDLDLEQVYHFHEAQRSALTQVCWQDRDHSEITGVYLVEPEVLSLIPPRSKFSLTQVRSLLPPDVVSVFTWDGYWNSLEDVRRYHEAPFELLEAAEIGFAQPQEMDNVGHRALRHLKVEGRRVRPGIWVGRNNNIHPSVRIAPPIYLDHNIQVSREASLGPRVILGENVIIDQEATLQDSVVLTNSYVGQLLHLNKRIVYKELLIDTVTGEAVRLNDPQLLSGVHPKLDQYGLGRAFDILVALLILALVSPILVLCALAIFLSGKPVLTPHIRWHSTHPGDRTLLRPFELLRFTTRESVRGQFRLGSFLETLEIDRLPEWINVLRGDCSAVGVKPLTPTEKELLTEEWHLQHFTVPAGITGLWYLRTNPDSSLEEVLVNDAYYAATRSRNGDLRILLETPLVWLRKTFTSVQLSPSAEGKA